jgi:hypothetical protein
LKESTLTTKIIKFIKSNYKNAYAVKYYGGMYGTAGTPDILACIDGKFFGLEVKVPQRKNNVSKLQDKTIKEINKAKGVAGVVTSIKEAQQLIEKGAKI